MNPRILEFKLYRSLLKSKGYDDAIGNQIFTYETYLTYDYRTCFMCDGKCIDHPLAYYFKRNKKDTSKLLMSCRNPQEIDSLLHIYLCAGCRNKVQLMAGIQK